MHLIICAQIADIYWWWLRTGLIGGYMYIEQHVDTVITQSFTGAAWHLQRQWWHWRLMGLKLAALCLCVWPAVALSTCCCCLHEHVWSYIYMNMNSYICTCTVLLHNMYMYAHCALNAYYDKCTCLSALSCDVLNALRQTNVTAF